MPDWKNIFPFSKKKVEKEFAPVDPPEKPEPMLPDQEPGSPKPKPKPVHPDIIPEEYNPPDPPEKPEEPQEPPQEPDKENGN